MASIATTIQIYDRISAPLNNIISALDSVCSAFDSVEASSNGAFDSSQIERVRQAIQTAQCQTSQLGQEQDDYNDEVDESIKKVNSLTNTIKKAATAFGGMKIVEKAVSWIASATAEASSQRKASVQLATTLANMGGTEKDYDFLSEKAAEIEKAGMYGGDAMTGAAAEFATYMTDKDAIALMMDTLTDYAAGMSGGGELGFDEIVGYATNLGKITTGAYDAMTKKGFEFTDAQKAIMDGTATESQLVEALGDGWQNMSEDMRAATVISNIINESWAGMYSALSDTPEGKLISLKNQFGEIQEAAGQRFDASLDGLWDTLMANMPTISSFIMGIANGLSLIIDLVNGIAIVFGWVGSFIAENWSIIAPILTGIGIALGLINSPLLVQAGLWLWNSVLVPIYNAVLNFLSIGYGVLSGSTAAASAAQFVYNKALLACPLTWILLIIIAVIAAIYVVIAVINKVAGTTISATGVIFGAISAAVSAIWNIFLTLVTFILKAVILPLTTAWDNFANFFGNIFTDPIATIIRVFEKLADTVLSILQTIAKGIDFVFGSNLAGTVQGWRDGLAGKADELVGKYGNGKYEEKSNATDKVNGFLDGMQEKLSLPTIQESYKWGYGIGEGIDDKVGDLFGGNGKKDEYDPEKLFEDSYESEHIPENIADIADNTGDAADSLEITKEDLKYLNDLAERETINRFTTAEIKVDMTNNNTVSSNMDLDGMVDYFAAGLNEALERTAEGVHV